MLILGANLGTSGAVAFNGIPAPPPLSWSPTEILVTVPAAPSYPFKGPVTVTTNGQTAAGPEFTITLPPTPAPPPAPTPPPTPSTLRPGDLDPSFGTGGQVLTDLGGGDSRASALALQPDGQIVVAGYSGTYPKAEFALARSQGR